MDPRPRKASVAHLPTEVLATVLAMTGDNPVRYAGVCKAWALAADHPDARRSLHLSLYESIDSPETRDAALSFSRFVCKRPPCTEALTLDIMTMSSSSELWAVKTALAPALVHLGPSLRHLVIERFVDLVTVAPVADVCTGLTMLKTSVAGALDLSRLRALVHADLCLAGKHAEDFVLPPSVRDLRLNVTMHAGPVAMARVQHAAERLPALQSLSLYTEHGGELVLSRLAPSLTSLVLGCSRRTKVEATHARLPDLRVLGLHRARVHADDLGHLLRQAKGLRALQLTDYELVGATRTAFDLTDLPLEVVIVDSSVAHPRALLRLPSTVRRLHLGGADVQDALQQSAVAGVRELVVELEGYGLRQFDNVWPRRVSLPSLQRVACVGCYYNEVAAALGQRCPAATISFCDYMPRDIELEYEVLSDDRVTV